jgi:hypothetical protein
MMRAGLSVRYFERKGEGRRNAAEWVTWSAATDPEQYTCDSKKDMLHNNNEAHLG